MTKMEDAVHQLGECYLEWSRALAKGDETKMEEMVNKAADIAEECDDSAEAMRLHTADRARLAGIRSLEKLLASLETEPAAKITILQ